MSRRTATSAAASTAVAVVVDEATGQVIRPDAPPVRVPAFRDAATARGAFADSFLRGIGLEELRAEQAKAEMMAAHVGRYINDPVRWVRERAKGFAWSKQRRILESVRDHRRTAVPSCHGTGKTKVASWICGWWLDAHPPGEAFVVTSATTERQIKALLWRELSRVKVAANMPGKLNQLEWRMVMPQGNEEIVAFGAKPADDDPAALHGVHAKYVLVVFDEAGGIATKLWDAADSLVSNEYSRFLAIGNPDDPESEFERNCRPGSDWNVISISAFDSPNFTGEEVPDELRPLLISRVWQEEKLRRWGPTNPMYLAKVLGQFPAVAAGGLFPSLWVRAAQEYDVIATSTAMPVPQDPVEIGMDVGGGGDKTTIALRRGGRVRIIYRGQNPSTMENLGLLMRLIEEHGVTRAKVDEVGLGKGVVDRAKELAEDQTKPKPIRDRAACIVGVNVGAAPNDREHYANLRAEAYWQLRERFQASANNDVLNAIDIDPEDEDLAAQLSDLSYKVTSHGKYQIESKDDMRRRGKVSPDDADAVMLAFTSGIQVPKLRGGAWGRKRNRKAGMRAPDSA